MYIIYRFHLLRLHTHTQQFHYYSEYDSIPKLDLGHAKSILGLDVPNLALFQM